MEVLIESDWNLKKTAEILKYEGKSRINRIRLEFKASPYYSGWNDNVLY